MGLMTEKEAKKRRCRVRAGLVVLLAIVEAIAKQSVTVAKESELCCNGNECAHWNFTDRTNPNNTDVEFLGYCGFSPPIEEFQVGLNNRVL